MSRGDWTYGGGPQRGRQDEWRSEDEQRWGRQQGGYEEGGGYGRRGYGQGGQGGQGGYWQGHGRGGYGQGGYGQGGYGQGGYGQGPSGEGNYADQGYGRQGGEGGREQSEYRGSGQPRGGQGGYGAGGQGYSGNFGGAYGGERYQGNFGQGGYGQGGYGQGAYGQGGSPGMIYSGYVITTFTGRGPRGYRRSDQRIEEEVNEELTRHPDIDASEIEVKVENGEVTLSGTVDHRHSKRLAEDIAERCAGVSDVHNRIRVKGGIGQKIADMFTGKGDREQERAGTSQGETGTRSRTGRSGSSTAS